MVIWAVYEYLQRAQQGEENTAGTRARGATCLGFQFSDSCQHARGHQHARAHRPGDSCQHAMTHQHARAHRPEIERVRIALQERLAAKMSSTHDYVYISVSES